jgi:amino acid transporter
MNAQMPIVRLVGSSLLAVLAAAALVLAVLMFFAAWATGSELTGWVANIGTVAVLVFAILFLVYAGVAAYAVREEWRARPLGRMLGLAVAVIAMLAAAVTLVMGNATEATELLYMAIALGAVTAVAMLLPDRAAN